MAHVAVIEWRRRRLSSMSGYSFLELWTREGGREAGGEGEGEQEEDGEGARGRGRGKGTGRVRGRGTNTTSQQVAAQNSRHDAEGRVEEAAAQRSCGPRNEMHIRPSVRRNTTSLTLPSITDSTLQPRLLLLQAPNLATLQPARWGHPAVSPPKAPSPRCCRRSLPPSVSVTARHSIL